MGPERFDRTAIVDHLKPHFPQLEGMTGEQVQAFLNTETGANVTDEMPNGVAFDEWRQALAKQKNKPELWPYTADAISKIKEKTKTLLEPK